MIQFLVDYWQDPSFNVTLADKVLYVNCKDICYLYKSEEGSVTREVREDLFCTHEEADTRMLFYVGKVDEPANVVIRTVNTDVLIIALGSLHLLHRNIQVWIESGLFTRNTLRYISVNQIFEKLGEDFCKALPAYHAFTGCDYTASFNRKDKMTPLKLLEKNEDLQEIFSRIDQWETICCERDFKKIESLVCSMYGRKGMSSVNEDMRLDMFLEKYRPKRCRSRSCEKHGCNYFSSMFQSTFGEAEKSKLHLWHLEKLLAGEYTAGDPLENGWSLEDGRYRIKWFEGDPAPKIVDVTNDLSGKKIYSILG